MSAQREEEVVRSTSLHCATHDAETLHRISQFENVTGLAFLVAVSEYDLCLREDSAQVRHDSL